MFCESSRANGMLPTIWVSHPLFPRLKTNPDLAPMNFLEASKSSWLKRLRLRSHMIESMKLDLWPREQAMILNDTLRSKHLSKSKCISVSFPSQPCRKNDEMFCTSLASFALLSRVGTIATCRSWFSMLHQATCASPLWMQHGSPCNCWQASTQVGWGQKTGLCEKPIALALKEKNSIKWKAYGRAYQAKWSADWSPRRYPIEM